MKNLQKFTIKSKTIELDSIDDFIRIYFFSDVHRDSSTCDVDRWKEFLKTAKSDKNKNVYFLGLGDYNDFASFSERKHINSGHLHETTMEKLEGIAERDNRMFARECSFMRGRLLGLVEGNHTWTFANGKSGTEDLAERLDTDYLGWLCSYMLKVVIKNRDSRKHLINMVLCHGKAGGKTSGASVNQVSDLRNIFPTAEIFVMAHDHQRFVKPESMLTHIEHANGEFSIRQKRQILIRTGAFKKAYVEDGDGYEIGRLFKPSDLGYVVADIHIRRKTSKGDDYLFTDIKCEI